MDLTKVVGGGTSNRGDFWQVPTVYQQARADVAALTAAIAQDRNALELLAGGPIADPLLPDALPEQLDWFADVPVGLSSAVLLDRPDVRAAEHDLQAANANIGAARARFFHLPLTASAAAITALGAVHGPSAVFTLARLSCRVSGGAKGLTRIQRDPSCCHRRYARHPNAFAGRRALVPAARSRTEAAQADPVDSSAELRACAGATMPDRHFLTTLVAASAYSARMLLAAQFAALGNRVPFRVLVAAPTDTPAHRRQTC